MTGKTAFVTGASGFIGTNLVKQLGEAGWSVIAMHRETSDLTYLSRFPATLVVGDIGDRDFLAGAIPDGVDAVFHVAGNVSFDSAGDEAQSGTGLKPSSRIALSHSMIWFWLVTMWISSLTSGLRALVALGGSTPTISATIPAAVANFSLAPARI